MEEKKLVFTVTELTKNIKKFLEELFPLLYVEGEISNLKYHSSGHLYFTLKDSAASISCVMWKSRVSQQLYKLTEGMKVVLSGSLTVYEPRGSYQIDCIKITPKGIGDLQIKFEELKNKLKLEGLFESENKKTIPEYPEKIGIVTSPTGAAIRDILNILNRRMPSVEIILYPVNVQGENSKFEIVEAINFFNSQNMVDVLIIGRGGGSLEDLWAFNEEIVARAIYNSKIPTISAVGHEVDFTIADFVSDLRAPTPSAAAELVVKDKNDVIEFIQNLLYNAENKIKNMISSELKNLNSIEKSYSFNFPIQQVRNYNQKTDELNLRMLKSFNHKFSNFKTILNHSTNELKNLKIDNILKRGFSIVRKNNLVVNDAKNLNNNEVVDIKFHIGNATAEIKSKNKND